MNYKKFFGTLFLSAALSLPASAYTVTPVAEAPQWHTDWSYNQPRPDWQEPDASAFSDFAVMIVTIEEELQPYCSDDDLLAVFVGDELRGLTGPLVTSDGTTDTARFLLKAYSNEGNGDVLDVTVKYYNAQLSQIFTLSESMTLDEDADYGLYKDFVPPLTLGSAKYPLTTTIDVSTTIAAAGLLAADGDTAAIFVGDECRGVTTMTGGQWLMANVYLREAGETVTLKYYNAARSRVYTFDRIVTADVNGDGVIDVADITAIVNAMASASTGESPASADVNGDGAVDVADISTIIIIMSVK